MTEIGSNCPAELRLWLTQAVQYDASDLHVVSGYPPMVRRHGELRRLDSPIIDHSKLAANLLPFLTESMRNQLEKGKNLDFSMSLPGEDGAQRFRVNYFYAARSLCGCFRVIPREIPSLEWAEFPSEVAERLCDYRNGLVLFSGVTGSGKSTSLAMIINTINQRGGSRIITVEEPVEYLFPQSPGSVVSQREVGVDVDTFSDGLKYGLRQDPDVILVGEVRDQETAKMALSAAETGHLVFSTLHTRDAKGAISRFADLFPQEVQGAILSQMAMSLRAVISQHLLPTPSAEKRVLALEVLYNTIPVAAGIRQGRVDSIDNNILTGRADGMITLSEYVRRLFQADRITRPTAERFVNDPSLLDRN
jgi:twitching motility protein PilT